MKRGFSTIELMIAMALMVMVLSAVVVVSFGTQSSLIGSQTNAEALKRAQGLLEQEQALARKDFNLVNATSTSDGFFTSTVTVSNAPGEGGHPFDYFSKVITATVSWKDELGVPRSFDMSTLVSNFSNSAGDTCNSSPEGNWHSPVTHSYSVASLASVSGTYGITALDAYLDRLYVAAGPTAANSDKTFFVFNLGAGVPSFINGSSVDTSGNSSAKGPNAIAVASSTAQNGKVYAFLANGVSPDWNSPSCILGSSCSQLQVIDVTDPANPSAVLNFKFATSSQSVPNYSPPFVNGNGGQAIGQSIAYRNGYIFLGLSNTGSGSEFHIIDVRALDMGNPLSIQPVGNYHVGASVEAIRVRGNFAYLATDDNVGGNTLTILDISDPTDPKRVWSPMSSASFGYGRDVASVGDALYFGMSYNSASPEAFVFANPTPSATKPVLAAGVNDLGVNIGVNRLLVRDYLLYLLTSGNTLEIRNATSTLSYAAPVALSAAGSALDCEGNYVYVGSSDPGGTITTLTGN